VADQACANEVCVRVHGTDYAQRVRNKIEAAGNALAFAVQKNVSKRQYDFRPLFLSYPGLYESLPFYEGICFEKAAMLLEAARFKDITSYDTSCFGTNPYGDTKRMKNTKPSFFIAHARR